jgi:hypothetical protein
MGTLTYPVTLTANTNENVNDLNSNLNAIAAVLNGNVDSNNIAAQGVTKAALELTLAQQLGISGGATTGRGKSIIATSESRSNAAYGTLTTPDQVTGIVLPTDGLMFIAYQARWQESVLGAARAAIFLGANQLKMNWVSSPQTQAAAINGSGGAGNDRVLVSAPAGLVSTNDVGPATADVTTGQSIAMTVLQPSLINMEIGGSVQGFVTSALAHAGGICAVFAAAGTYTVSVQFKASSGSVTANNRKLWCWTLGF